MTNTLADPGPYDALGKAQPDEPFFPLVARDEHAPATVLHWVDLTRGAVCAEIADLPRHQPVPDRCRDKLRQCTEAELIAWEMRRWRSGEPEHDTAARKVTYSGAAMDAASLDEAARKAEHTRGVADLREAAYYACEGSARLDKVGLLEPEQIIALQEALTTINRIADAHTPRRPNFDLQEALPLPEPEAADVPAEQEPEA